MRPLWFVLPMLVLVGASVLFVFKKESVRLPPLTEQNSSGTNPESPRLVGNGLTNAPASHKSIDDLKVASIITLEKTKGSSLIYAVGLLKNDSIHQRYGVTIELELTDAGGNRAGTAKDYRAVLEPRQEWRFRALVLDSKAASAKVAVIREEE